MPHTPTLPEGKKLLGHKIATIRKKKGYTQERFAEAIQISHAHLASIEIGRHAPRLDTLLRIVAELDVKVRDLIPF